MRLLPAFFVASVLGYAVSTLLTSTWKKVASLDGYLASPGTVKTALSTIQCGMLCTSDRACMSYFFKAGVSVSNCQLHDMVFQTNSGMLPTPNVTYYNPANYSVPTFQCHPNDGEYRTMLLPDNTIFTYKFHATEADYSGSTSACVSESGNLVRITTSAKMEMIRDLLFCPDFTSISTVFVDGRYSAGLWYFGNNYEYNATFPTPFWAPGCPYDFQFKCSKLLRSLNWYAENWSCSNPQHFICEK